MGAVIADTDKSPDDGKNASRDRARAQEGNDSRAGETQSGRKPRRDRSAMKKAGWRGLIEVGFIVFLFYSNLLMGEFERSAVGPRKGFFWALSDVVTSSNLFIAAIAAIVGYILFEFLRTKF